jgi:4-amino-4-deoxy-L-arabinose transferase-like glycosyltransferase
MDLPSPESTSISHRWRWRLLAAAFIILAAAGHITYFTIYPQFDLAPDEAHYWDWSRHLDWSYYSKGPLVAYLIRLGCLIAGPWSQQLTGNEALAVRLPAVLCGSLLLLSVYILTVQVFRNEKWAAGVVALALTLPLVVAGASLMTIDAPYTCCWGWALVCAHRAIFRPSPWAWPLAGLFIGLGILAKYTMLLFVPSLGLFLLFTPAFRDCLRRPGFWLMALVGASCCLPILIWNVQNDWVSWRHVSKQAGGGETGILWLGPLSYLGTQFAMLLGFWFTAWLAALWRHRPWRETDNGRRYLWCMSVPMFTVFLLFSLKTREEPNWPITAYIAGLVLTVNWLVEQLQAQGLQGRLVRVGTGLTCLVGIFLSLLMHDPRRAQPLFLRMGGPATVERPFPLRRFDPTCRLRGWAFLAGEVERVRAELRAQGIEPVLVSHVWNIPGEIAFYCPDHPTVYSLGIVLGDRHSQYDLWRPNPLCDPEQFAGRTFIMIGRYPLPLSRGFTCVMPATRIVYEERGQAVEEWYLTVCHGYRGFPRETNRNW